MVDKLEETKKKLEKMDTSKDIFKGLIVKIQTKVISVKQKGYTPKYVVISKDYADLYIECLRNIQSQTNDKRDVSKVSKVLGLGLIVTEIPDVIEVY